MCCAGDVLCDGAWFVCCVFVCFVLCACAVCVDYCLMLSGSVLCVVVYLCVLCLFTVCDLFVNMLNGVVWFGCLNYCVCLCVAVV